MDLGVQIQRIHNEDLIWIIYIFVAVAALASDYFEENYLKTKDKKCKDTFHRINIIVLVIVFFVYIYFISLRLEDLQRINSKSTKKEVITSHIGFLSSLFFLIGGILAIYLELKSQEPDEVGII